MMKWKLILMILFFVLLGCQTEETAVSPDDPARIPKPRYDGPRSENGTGNVYGEVRWNGSAAAGLDVLLCQDFSSFSGCGGREVTAVTDETGAYLFQNIAPGTYALSIHIFDSGDWMTVSDGILSWAGFVVEADETLVIETQSIYKLDLRPLEPGQQAKLKSGSQTFNWEAYPAAAYYEIYLTPDKGETIFVSQRVDANQIAAELPPINCDYRWSLEAFKDDSSVPAHGIVLEWEPHPLAASYKILMWDDSDEDRTNTLDFITVTESRFAFNGALTPDHRYVWSVYAYDAEGKEIAASEIYDFTVIADNSFTFVDMGRKPGRGDRETTPSV